MSAGPNLLAWAKDNSVIAPELFCVSHALSALARAILADEEETKLDASDTIVINIAEQEQMRMDWLRDFNNPKSEPPSE